VAAVVNGAEKREAGAWMNQPCLPVIVNIQTTTRREISSRSSTALRRYCRNLQTTLPPAIQVSVLN
jgi:hypothetical protein